MPQNNEERYYNEYKRKETPLFKLSLKYLIVSRENLELYRSQSPEDDAMYLNVHEHFIVSVSKPDDGKVHGPLLDNTLPFIAASWDNGEGEIFEDKTLDDELLLKWTEKYDLAIPTRQFYRSARFILRDSDANRMNGVSGKVVKSIISTDELRSALSDIKIAVQLWHCTENQEFAKLREIIESHKERIVTFLARYPFLEKIVLKHQPTVELGEKITEEDISRLIHAGDHITLLHIAGEFLGHLVSEGLNDYRPILGVRMNYRTLDSPSYLRFENTIARENALSFIWSVIEEGIVRGNKKKWPYKKCEECGKTWLYIGGVGRSPKRCESCGKQRNREHNTKDVDAHRKRQKGKKNSPSSV